MKNNHTPAIRFKGYTKAWEQRKLGEVVKRVTRKNKDLESTLPLTISAQDGLIDQNEFFNKTVASRDVSGYYLVRNGEFAYNKSYSNGYPWGAVKRLNRYDMGVLSTLYIVFKTTDINSDFLAKYYDTTYWYREVSKHAAEGARNHGLLNIAASDFFETELMVPKDSEEQKNIGDFFNQLDHLITLHQCKLDHLQDVKKGLLQKMFPKDGADVPEIRFPGFTDAWEQRQLIEVADYRNGKAHEQDIDEDGDYIVVNSKFVSSNGRVKKYSNVLIEPLETGEIAFVLSDVPNGKAIARTFLVDENNKYSLNQRIAGITPHDDTDPYFLSILMNRNYYFLKFDTGVGQTNLSKSEVENFSERYPNYDEQHKIGAFFKDFDNLITLHQRELNDLKETKKAFLQKMFV